MPFNPHWVRQIVDLIPSFVSDIHISNPGEPELYSAIRSRARTCLHSGADEAQSLDCYVSLLAGPRDGGPDFPAMASVLRADGCAMLIALPGSEAPVLGDLANLLGIAGLVLYRSHSVQAQGNDSLRDGYVVFAVHSTYNPVSHARALMLARRADCAFDVLQQVPPELQQDPAVAARIAAEKLVCLLAWDRAAGEKDRLARFFFSQVTFYNAVAVAPMAHEVYLCHGEFWKRVGDRAMNRRLLRSTFHQAPANVRLQVDIPEPAEPPVRREFTAPEWRMPHTQPRVLFILSARPHYGLDVLYYGLCEVLGDENVVEYPHKPSLHGTIPSELAHYPCMFNRRGREFARDEVLRELKTGAFDLVIYGDLEGGVDVETARAIKRAAGDTPIVLVDAQDDPLDHWDNMNEFIGGGLALYFKREMLTCWNYGAHTVPLPFAYADERVPAMIPAARQSPLFWAGHRQFGLRRLYLEYVESAFGLDLSKSFAQDSYAAALGDARIGLNIFGFGFDTVRYWEIPAHGAMLLAERPPIHIPHDFVDGESAIFFEDLPDLEEKLRYWMGRKEEAAHIAAQGHERLRRFHTASARARQMLGCVQALVPGWTVR